MAFDELAFQQQRLALGTGDGNLDIRHPRHHRLLFRRGGMAFKIGGDTVFEVFRFADINYLAVIGKHHVDARPLGQVLEKMIYIEGYFQTVQLRECFPLKLTASR